MNCNTCEPKYVPGRLRTPRKRPCPYQPGEPVPPFKPELKACGCKPAKITLRTVTIPANLGDDTGEYAPKPGAYYDTILLFLANGAVYIYDSNGVFTEVEPGGFQELVETVGSFKQAINELYNPAKIAFMVKDYEQVQALAPDTVPAGQFVLVTEDEMHNNRPSLYYYNTAAGEWSYAYAASPYYEKSFIDSAIENLQTNINNVMNKEIEDVNNLQTNINAEVNARTVADTEINQRITDIQNSPDVRYIVGTYAELEELDKAEVGDKDYARVLQDENHEGASTYYQFNLADQTWTYVGEVGSYYTKAQIDAKFEEVPKVPASMVYDFVSPAGDNNPSTADNANITARVVNTTTGNVTNATLMMPMASETQAGSITADDKAKLSSLLAIKSLNDSLSLSEEGELSVVGGGSDVNLLNEYTASPAEGDVYNAEYVNSRLDYTRLKMGEGAITTTNAVAIGYQAKALGPHEGQVVIGSGSTCYGQSGLALGAAAYVGTSYSFSVALGNSTKALRANEVSIGNPELPGSEGNSPKTRFLANVTAGELDTDAVNVSQLNAALARIEALETEVAALKG